MSATLSPSLRRRLAHAAPIVCVRPARAAHVVERSVYVYRQNWLFILSGFLEPVFYLFSIGVGLSHLIGSVSFSGHALTYTRFVAPGLMATSAMNGSIADSTFNVFFKLKVTKVYDSVLATPISVSDATLGEVGWAVCRGTIYACGFIAVMAGLGLVGSYWALLCVPVASLIALSFASVGIAVTSHMRSWQDLSAVTLAVLPLFLFSGTFFALSVYPRPVALFIEATPLYQGVAILRALDNGIITPGLAYHVLYLVVVAAVGLVAASRQLARLLTP